MHARLPSALRFASSSWLASGLSLIVLLTPSPSLVGQGIVELPPAQLKLVAGTVDTLMKQADEFIEDGQAEEAIAGGGDETANMVTGYFWSIIFMLSVPAMIFCGLGSYFYLLVHRARRLDPTGEHRQLSILNQPLDPEHRKQLEELAHAP